MNLYWFIPLTIGCVMVLQGTLNRQMGQAMGLANAVVLNSIIVLAASLVLFGVTRLWPQAVPPFFSGEFTLAKLAGWMIFPGIFGFCIIAGIPWAISKLGASRVFVAVVVAQIVASMLWDIFVEKQPIGWMRISGATLAVLGVILVSMDRS